MATTRRKKNNTAPIQSQPGSSEYILDRLVAIIQHQSQTTQEFLDHALQEAIRITGSKIGYIYHYHENRKELVLNTWSKEVMAECTVANPQTCYELAKTGIWGEVVRQRKPIIVNDFQKANPLKKGTPPGHVALMKHLTTPVFKGEEIVGVVGVANKETNYSQVDVLQLQLLMNSVWRVVDLHQAIEREQYLKKVLFGIRNVNQLIIQEDNPEHLIQKAVVRLTESFGYLSAWIALVDKDMKICDEASSGFEKNGDASGKSSHYGECCEYKKATLPGQKIAVFNSVQAKCSGCPAPKAPDGQAVLCATLSYASKIYGVLSVAISADYAYISEAQDLFSGLSNDLGFALYKNSLERQNLESIAAIKESEEKFRLIAENTGDNIIVMDMNLNITYVSPSIYKLRGYTVDEARRQTLDQIFTPQSLQKGLQLFAEEMAVEESGRGDPNRVRNLELEEFRKDGSIIWVEITMSFIRDNNSTPVGIVTLTKDITARRQMETDLKERERTLSTLIGNLPGFIYRCKNDKNWSMIYISGRCEEITGYAPDGLIDNKKTAFNDIIVPKYREYLWGKWQQVISENIPFQEEFEILHSSGEHRWVWERGRGIFNDAGELLFLEGFITDITSEKKAREALIESDARYQTFINTNTDLMFVKDERFRYIVANDALARYFGKPKDEILYKTDFELMDKLAAEECRASDLEALKQNCVVVSEESEGLLMFETTKFPLPLDNGIYGVGGLVRDITRQKKVEKIQNLQYNVAHAMATAGNLNGLFETVRKELGVLMDATNFYIVFYNEQTGILFSPFEKDEKDSIAEWPAEKSLTGRVIKQERSILLNKNEISQLASTGEVDLIGSRAEQWLGVPLTTGGKISGAMVVQSYENPMSYDKESVLVLEIIAKQLGVYIERKKSDDTAHKLSTATLQSPACVVITNTKGIIEFVNPKFTELTGYSQQEAIGKSPAILKSGLHNEGFYKNLWDIILSGKSWKGEFCNKKKNGALYWESAIISPIFNAQGSITHFVAIKEDITEKKQMLEDLVMAKERAEASDRLKTAFMNNISHEIRTPLNGILGFGQMMAYQNLSEHERQEYFQILQKSTDRLVRTITDYMDISLIASNNLTVNSRAFILNELMQDLFQQIHNDGKAKSIEIDMRLPDNADELSLVSDKELLRKVLLYLLENALKFTPRGMISFGCRKKDDCLEFFVQDSGIGISNEVIVNVFDPFWQEETGDARGYEGSGLGLSIAKGIINKLGGLIWLESEKDKGTTFYFTLPYIETDKVGTRRKLVGLSGSEHLTGRPIVLVAEDDDLNYFYIEVVLQKAGYIVDRAINGAVAVEKCIQQPEIGLVLMDIKMPVMDGLKATHLIKEQRNELPIIAITAYALIGDEHRVMEAGCDGYLPKPVKKELLLKTLERYVLKHIE